MGVPIFMGSPNFMTLPPTNDAGSTAEIPPHEGRIGELQDGGPSRGLVYLSLMRYLGHTHALGQTKLVTCFSDAADPFFVNQWKNVN